MVIGFIFAVLLFALIVVGALVALVGRKNKKRAQSLVGAIITLLCIIGFVTIPASFHTIEAGEIAVVNHLG